MSGLAGLLAHHHGPGVYRWVAAAPPEDVAHTVERAGWRFGYVDGWRHQTRAEFLTAVGEALAFAPHYGRNLDALNDCLRDVPAATVLLWDGWGTLARADEAAFAAVRTILGEHALTTLLRGEGPALDVPLLE
ncbi:barstar family protein [Nocardioides anomalus]|uniref:Barstar family protein n=1 Tax=Nocardioides anomalus TaxID=2712223 RepID=A0A6G6WBH9_9ACTN|nr:barstar family protein [Nocardioides anomalus]QIG42566.1 barstar family protein [Nocardioides anomalus]